MENQLDFTMVDFCKIQNRLSRMLYLFHQLYENEYILMEEAQLMKRTLFKDEQKILPALKSYEKSHNLIDFIDRMRGYLGLPRRRSSIMKSSQASSFRKSSHQVQSRFEPLRIGLVSPVQLASGSGCSKKEEGDSKNNNSSSSNNDKSSSMCTSDEAKDTVSCVVVKNIMGSLNQLSPINQGMDTTAYDSSQYGKDQRQETKTNKNSRKMTDQYLSVPQKTFIQEKFNLNSGSNNTMTTPINTITIFKEAGTLNNSNQDLEYLIQANRHPVHQDVFITQKREIIDQFQQ